MLVLNTKKTQLAKLKDQLDSYENGNSHTKNGKTHSIEIENNFSIPFSYVDKETFESPDISTVRSVSPTFDDDEHGTKKRTKYQSDEADTSDEVP